MAFAQEQPTLEIRALNQIIPGGPTGSITTQGDLLTGIVRGTNGIYVKYGATVLTADEVALNRATGDIVADGHVRIQTGDQIWVGEHITYNMNTRLMQSEQFRAGMSPLYASGRELQGNATNKTYEARHAFVTTDDIFDPTFRVRSSHITIVPGKYVELWNAVVFMGDVPVFYFPYYRRNIGPHANNLNFAAGYRSQYGGFLRNTYTWWYDDNLDGKFHLDYYSERGVGVGPDLNLHLGQWGEAQFKYYYLHDHNPIRRHKRPAGLRPGVREPPARLFRLAGDALHEPEPQGVGQLPERRLPGTRFFRKRLRGKSAAEHVPRGE